MGLLFRVTHLNQLSLRQVIREGRKSLGHDLRGKPVLLEGLSEASLLGNSLIYPGSHNTGGLNQGVSEPFTTHTSIDNRVPVLQVNYASRDSLRKLSVCSRGLLSCRTRGRCEV